VTAQQLHDRLKSGGATFFGEVVLVAREKAVSQTKSGLYIPDTAQAKQQYAAVVGFGDESIFGPGGAKDGKVGVGDALYVPSYGGVVVKQKIGDEVYVLEALHDKDILLAYKGDADVELEAGGSQTSA
jgi:co-chaperonin GroES (HSP10)